MFPASLAYSIAGKYRDVEWKYQTINIRDFGIGKHKNVDDKAYGHTGGMVVRPDVLGEAIDHAISLNPDDTKIIYFSPKGKIINQEMISDYTSEDKNLILICARFEAIDERIIEYYPITEVSLGDFILSGGEPAAIAFMDACIRILPNVHQNQENINLESFGEDKYKYLLEHPQYTRPPIWRDMKVSEILCTGHHKNIVEWQFEQAQKVTKERRPDLWEKHEMQNKRSYNRS